MMNTDAYYREFFTNANFARTNIFFVTLQKLYILCDESL